MKCISHSKLKSSNFSILPKVHKFKKIIEKINAGDNIGLTIQSPQYLKGRSIVGGPNSSTQGIMSYLEKLLTVIDPFFKTNIINDWNFNRKLPSYVRHSCVLASRDVYIRVSLITQYQRHFLIGLTKKQNLIPERFTKALILEVAQF